MRFKSLILCILIHFYSLLVKLTAASTAVSVDFYIASECSTPSTLTPNASIPLNVCADTRGLISFYVDHASCPNGDLTVWVYLDPTCGNAFRYLYTNECWSPNAPNAVAALVLACGDDQPIPTATTTFTVGDVITLAPDTQVPVSSATGSRSATNLQNAATTTVASNNGNGGTSASTDSSSGSGSGGGWSSLTYAEKVGIIVAIAVALPGIILAWMTYRFMKYGH